MWLTILMGGLAGGLARVVYTEACFYVRQGFNHLVKKYGYVRVRNKAEEECREIFQDLFHTPFPTTRKVEWLKNPKTGRHLELDGYNGHLAFEYDGPHHKIAQTSLGQTAETLQDVRDRDSVKDKLCRHHHLPLIRIPHTVKPAQFRSFIISELERQKIRIPSVFRRWLYSLASLSAIPWFVSGMLTSLAFLLVWP